VAGRVDVTSLVVNARGEYWNHNSAYHPWILQATTGRRASALDVGCGEGLLVQRLATVYGRVVGIDPDPKAVSRARHRAVDLPTVDLFECGLLDYEPGEQFDLVTAIATLHHLNLRAGLRKLASLVRPGGALRIVGLAASQTPLDLLVDLARLPLVRLSGALHHEADPIGVATMDPQQGLREIRATAGQELPGANLRRGLYYRYLLNWDRSA
jgi:SAM-dependent methyltransferase